VIAWSDPIAPPSTPGPTAPDASASQPATVQALLRPLIDDIVAGVQHGADRLARLQRLTDVEEVDWGPGIGTTIRL
jgi:hypothetical protein